MDLSPGLAPITAVEESPWSHLLVHSPNQRSLNSLRPRFRDTRDQFVHSGKQELQDGGWVRFLVPENQVDGWRISFEGTLGYGVG